MHPSQLHYLPLTPPFFSILVGLFFVIILMVQLGAMRYAYTRLGLSPGAALFLLFASLVGSYFNIPITKLRPEQVMNGGEIYFYGMRYVVPLVTQAPSTVLAVNVGGAVIPTVMSAYLLMKYQLWGRGLVAVAVVTAVCHLMATPVRGLGIAEPIFVPALTAAVTALLLSRTYAAPLAYVAGSLGTLIGADLLNLGNIQGLGAPVASIGGAGTFDGIFVIGVMACLIASFTGGSPDPTPAKA